MLQYKLKILALLLTLFFSITPAFSDETEELTTKIENYFNSIDTVKAKFIQKDQAGNESSGHFWLSKPGRLKLEYPHVDVVLNRGSVTYYDYKLDEFAKFSNNRPLLGFLTQKDFSFQRAGQKASVIQEGDQYVVSITVRDKELGLVDFDIYFDKSPLKFKGFSLKDSKGTSTKVTLIDASYNTPISSNVFEIQNSRFLREKTPR